MHITSVFSVAQIPILTPACAVNFDTNFLYPKNVKFLFYMQISPILWAVCMWNFNRQHFVQSLFEGAKIRTAPRSCRESNSLRTTSIRLDEGFTTLWIAKNMQRAW